jgi:hypothetical protein
MQITTKFFVFFILFFTSIIHADESKTNLTIYSTVDPGSISPELYRPTLNGQVNYSIPGYAIIRDRQEMDLKEGTNKINFPGVATYIDPTTVSLKSLTDPNGTRVLEQTYFFDLANKQALLAKYLGQEITVEQFQNDHLVSFTGKLINSNDGLILQNDDKLTSINHYSNIRFTNLPGIITKPTLTWNIVAQKSGKQQMEIAYQTSGITWWADYNAIFTDTEDASKGFLSLSAWVSIINKSGANYENANLKLVAGHVKSIKNNRHAPMAMMAIKATNNTETAGFSERAFFEYHLYTLERTITLPDNTTKQIELFKSIDKIPVIKQYYYKGAADNPFYGINTNRDIGVEGNTKVDVYLKLSNDKKSELGFALPAGRIRVSKIDTGGSAPTPEFIGENVINHTAIDENIIIKIGSAFDMVGERKQVNFNVDNARHIMNETFEITIRNHKNQNVEVTVIEPMNRGENWKILENSSNYEKIDSKTIHFPLVIKKDSEGKIRYTVQYTWQ